MVLVLVLPLGFVKQHATHTPSLAMTTQSTVQASLLAYEGCRRRTSSAFGQGREDVVSG